LYQYMSVFIWKKPTESNNPVDLIKEQLEELKKELRQAQYNNNWKRAAFLKKQIEQIENIK